jgi:hypothetical protein
VNVSVTDPAGAGVGTGDGLEGGDEVNPGVGIVGATLGPGPFFGLDVKLVPPTC